MTKHAIAIRLFGRGAVQNKPFFVSNVRYLASDDSSSSKNPKNISSAATTEAKGDLKAKETRKESNPSEATEANKRSLSSDDGNKSKDEVSAKQATEPPSATAKEKPENIKAKEEKSNLREESLASVNSSETSVKKENSDNASSVSSFLDLERMQRIVQDTSGLTELQQLKQAVEEASAQFDKATQQVADCRVQVEEAQKAHDLAHKKHVNLLMRREDWSGDDAQSFVHITSEEVTTRQNLLEAQTALKRAEDNAITTQHAYMDAMRKRYHEEQLWQDKWRLLGTYGTWSLIGINTMVFIGGQIVTQRREINRLKRMEQLLVQHQEENRRIYEASSSAGTTVVAAATAEGDETAAEETTSRSDTEITAGVTEAKDEGEGLPPDATPVQVLRYKLSKSLRHLQPLHTPSMAVGAAASASACMILMVLLSSNRR